MTKTRISKSKAIKIIRAIRKEEVFITEGEPPYVGRKNLLEKVDRELEEVEKGEAMFRMVKGEQGQGKTHFLSVIREKAFNKEFVVSSINLSQNDTTLNKIEKIYKKFIKNLRVNKYRKASALDYILNKWSKEADSKNYSYCCHGMKPFTCGYPVCRVPKEFHLLKNDIQSALRVCRDEWKYGNGKITPNLDLVIKWFSGAKVLLREIKTVGIENRVERNNAIEYMGEICKLINHLDYKGIVILIDEDEPESSIAADKTMESFNNLALIRNRLIRFPNIYILYAACHDFYRLLMPDGNITEEGYANISRLIDIPIEFMDKASSIKEVENMTFNLDNLSFNEIEEIAQNLLDIYEAGYDWTATEEVYCRIFREFIPQAVKKHTPVGKIYFNLVTILDKGRQESGKTLQDLNDSDLNWTNEFHSSQF
ncbi:MAG: hypothetical protein BWY64_00872 [bacterium ADurb.Bin363]|nr:MAG: hypothetical protein BWY64_00872 [bacterium ADurb.Bin363]